MHKGKKMKSPRKALKLFSDNFAKLIFSILVVVATFGCNSPAPPAVPDKAASEASVIEARGIVPIERVLAAIDELKETSTSQEIANTILEISDMNISDADIRKVSELEKKLLSRLRGQIKSEVLAIHQEGLKSSSYAEGYAAIREAGSILAMYPLSEDKGVIKEAEELSMRQKEALNRLNMIRRQKYNYWAAERIDQGLTEIRKSRIEQAMNYLQIIEPSLLEPSVASLYSYAVTEIMDEFSEADKSSVALKLTAPSVSRRGLESF